MLHHRLSLKSSSPSITTLCDILSLFPEEILLYVLSLLDTTDLHNTCLVNTVWRRLCEDEFIYRSICGKKFPCLRGEIHPPYEDTWRHFYTARKARFAVIGGPISQAACMDVGIHLQQIESSRFAPRGRYFCTKEDTDTHRVAKVSFLYFTSMRDGSQMGDLLADYVDNGGGVVVTVFTNCNNLRNGFVKGRFLDGGYHPITPSRQHDTNGKRPLTLGRIYDTNHPIMQQVRTIDGGKSSFFCPGALNPEGKLVAEWSNGVPLIVELPKGKGTVVGLNFFPPSCDTGDPRFWNSNSDGAIAMANALAYAGGSHVLRKRRTISKRSLDIKSDGASEARVRDAQGNWVKDPLQRSISTPNLGTSSSTSSSSEPPKKKKPLPVKIFGKRLFTKWLSFRKAESTG